MKHLMGAPRIERRYTFDAGKTHPFVAGNPPMMNIYTAPRRRHPKTPQTGIARPQLREDSPARLYSCGHKMGP